MANYKCTQCEATCESECAQDKAIVPTGPFKDVTSIRFGGTANKPTAAIQIDQTEDLDKLRADIKRQVDNLFMPNPHWGMLKCEHEWELLDAKCDLGCCTRKEDSDNASV